MTRRDLIAASAAMAVGAARASAAELAQRSLFEVRIFRLRNGPENQRQNTVASLSNYVPLVNLAGAGPVAVLSSSIAEDAPSLLAITSFKGYADMDACQTKLHATPDYVKARGEWYAGGSPCERGDLRLL